MEHISLFGNMLQGDIHWILYVIPVALLLGFVGAGETGKPLLDGRYLLVTDPLNYQLEASLSCQSRYNGSLVIFDNLQQWLDIDRALADLLNNTKSATEMWVGGRPAFGVTSGVKLSSCSDMRADGESCLVMADHEYFTSTLKETCNMRFLMFSKSCSGKKRPYLCRLPFTVTTTVAPTTSSTTLATTTVEKRSTLPARQEQPCNCVVIIASLSVICFILLIILIITLVMRFAQRRKVSKKGLLSDKNMDLIANELGHNWRTVGINLEYSWAELEQLEDSYRNPQTRNCAMLIRWRERSSWKKNAWKELSDAFQIAGRLDLVEKYLPIAKTSMADSTA